MIIAVDGPAASGKGVISKALGEIYGLPVLDTGLLYRGVAAAALAAGADLDDAVACGAAAAALDVAGLDEARLRAAAIGEAASRVSVHPAVRAALLAVQRDFAARPGGAILDGRDIGTVIVPDAAAKLFVTASPEARAHRRWLQFQERGEPHSLEAVLADIHRRDERDSERSAAPLRRADDAVLLDTTQLDIAASIDAARRIVEAARARREP
jgi:CMP/dCMP kinase